MRTPIINFFEKLEGFFLYTKLLTSYFNLTIHVPIQFSLSYRQSGVNVQHNVVTFKSFTHVFNSISVHVEVVTFAIIQIDNFCKQEVNTV